MVEGGKFTEKYVQLKQRDPTADAQSPFHVFPV